MHRLAEVSLPPKEDVQLEWSARAFTGNTRYRVEKRWFRPDLVVLQVQIEGKPTSTGCYPLVQTWWVDARPEMFMRKLRFAHTGD